jgi:uncharacterized SAM-binding protein YcdF (DUF218 family)
MRWGLSWQGWLVLVAVMATTFGLFLFDAYPFLALTRRVDANILVVEGWVHDYAIGAAAEEFRKGGYQEVISTGGPVEGIGHYINDYQTVASVGAELLKKHGLPEESVQMVPSRVMDRDRTYGSAVALADWLRTQHPEVRKINVVTENVHARRTQLLFQEALGPNVAVGVIAEKSPDYDPHRWWRYSQGVKDVVAEMVAYVYAKCFFWPRSGQ